MQRSPYRTRNLIMRKIDERRQERIGWFVGVGIGLLAAAVIVTQLSIWAAR